MKIKLANQRFEGEWVVQTAPEMSNRISSNDSYLRPNLYTGRALTADTLISKTKHRIRHMQLFGRHLSHGVINGLTLTSYVRSYADADGTGKTEQWLRLTAGLGITNWGEDVTLPETADIFLDSVPLWKSEIPPLLQWKYDYFAYNDSMWESETPARGAGIFVLQPLEIFEEIVENKNIQCQWDEEQDPFKDEQIVDGCRLVFFPWPADVLGAIPAVQSVTFRNQLAYRIFDYEKEHPDTPLPWEHVGIPVGLAYIRSDMGTILFIDRDAVARKGGAPLATKTMLSMNGTPFLWESRIQQFVGHLYDIRQTVNEISSAHAYFEVLPPVGILPRQALNFDTMSTGFFPSQFIIDAVPIPEEQLEVAMNASSGLTPLDLHQPEKIKLLVPVPQSVYEPALLKKEEPDPVFLETLRKLVSEIRKGLANRKYLRDMAERVIGAINVAQIPLFGDDPDIIPDEKIFPVMIETRDDITDFGALAGDAIRNLYAWIQENAPGVSAKVIAPLLRFPERSDGLKNIIHALMYDIQKTSSFKIIENVSMNVKTNEEKEENCKLLDGFMSGLQQEIQQTESFKGLKDFVNNIKNDIKINDRQAEVFQAFKGIENFILDLKNNIQKTENLLDSGYVKAEADMYRLRQLMLGNVKTTRLATSSALGQIISGEDTQLTGAAVESYLKDAEKTKVQTATPSSSGGTGSKTSATMGGRINPADFFKDTIGIRKKPLINRIYDSPAVEVKTNAVKTKAAIIDSMINVPFEMDDELVVAGSGKSILKEADVINIRNNTCKSDNERNAFNSRVIPAGNYYVITTASLSENETKNFKLNDESIINVNKILNDQEDKKSVSYSELKSDTGLRNSIRDGILEDVVPADPDEANVFTVGVSALEHAMNTMRVIEQRLDDYKKALTQSRNVFEFLQSNAAGWKDKLGEIDNKIEVLRHDALVTRSLYEEEVSRLAAINEKRKAILDTYVTTLVFVRPRLVDPRLDVSALPLYAEYVNPVPACLAEDFEATGELADMLDVFRKVPVAWLTQAKGLVKLVTDRSSLADIMKGAASKNVAAASMMTEFLTPSYQAYNTHEFGKVMNKIIYSNQQNMQALARQKMALNIAGISTKTWLELTDQAEAIVSLADLIEKGKGNSRLARDATEIMENLEDVAVCLYHRCDELEPVIKLRWANLISEYDNPVDLRHLETLPSFDKIDFTIRRDLQNMVDWLFSQVDNNVERARQTMNDLVRVCILLAGHAPVSTIVKGYVETPSIGKIGDFIDIVADKGMIKVGMIATVITTQAVDYQKEPVQVVAAQGVVTDIGQNAARVKVTQSAGSSAEFSIDKGAQVKFTSGKFSKTLS